MSDAEVQLERRTLLREQELWAQKKVDADRYLTRLRAEITTLEPKAERLRDTVAQLKEQISKHERTAHERLAYLARLQKDIDDNDTLLVRLDQLIVEAQQQLADEQESISRKLRGYEADEQALIERNIHTKNEELQALTTEISALRPVLATREQEIEDLQSKYKAEEVNLKNRCRLLETDKDASLVELRQLQLDAQQARLITQQLLANNNNLALEKDKLLKENLNFKNYEIKARRQLEIADSALQERERIILEKEQYQPQTRSFLPPSSA